MNNIKKKKWNIYSYKYIYIYIFVYIFVSSKNYMDNGVYKHVILEILISK